MLVVSLLLFTVNTVLIVLLVFQKKDYIRLQSDEKRMREENALLNTENEKYIASLGEEITKTYCKKNK